MTPIESRRFEAMLAKAVPGSGPSAWLNRFRFTREAKRHARAYAPLLDAPSGSTMAQLVEDRPEILAFVRAPYLCSGWPTDERLARFAAQIATKGKFPALDFPVAQSIELMLLGDLGETFHVVIDKPMWFHREGTHALNLFDDNTRLFTLVFAFEPAPGGLRALIGGIQGRDLPNILDRYRDLTKAAHGIRPRDLIIELFRMLCTQAGVTEIHAISDRGRHNRHPYFGKPVLRPLPLDYDEIWRDRNATQIDRWFWNLPLTAERRPDADIAPKKRSMYRQRYAMLDRIAEAMPHAWANMTPVSRPDAL